VSSTWYLVRSLRTIGTLAGLPAFVNLVCGFTGPSWKGGQYLHEASVHLIPFIVVAVVVSFSVYAKRKIEDFLHLQRVWKLVALLETAFLVSLQEADFFKGIELAGPEDGGDLVVASISVIIEEVRIDPGEDQ
jgi:hypothetical protein